MFKEALRQGAIDLAREMGDKPINENKSHKVVTGKKKFFARIQSALKLLLVVKPR